MPCIRSGQCCKKLMLHLSPRQLRETPENYEDGQIIADMLKGRCLGKEKYPEGYSYWYGPCANLAFTNGLAVCLIQDKKPRMCSGYPDYHKDIPGGMLVFKGCGYEGPGTQTAVPFEQRVLEPLSEEEK